MPPASGLPVSPQSVPLSPPSQTSVWPHHLASLPHSMSPKPWVPFCFQASSLVGSCPPLPSLDLTPHLAAVSSSAAHRRGREHRNRPHSAARSCWSSGCAGSRLRPAPAAAVRGALPPRGPLRDSPGEVACCPPERGPRAWGRPWASGAVLWGLRLRVQDRDLRTEVLGGFEAVGSGGLGFGARGLGV